MFVNDFVTLGKVPEKSIDFIISVAKTDAERVLDVPESIPVFFNVDFSVLALVNQTEDLTDNGVQRLIFLILCVLAELDRSSDSSENAGSSEFHCFVFAFSFNF